jgi:hypothetical protein
MAIQTVIPGRKGRREILLDQLRDARDSDETLALERLEREQELNRARDPNIPSTEIPAGYTLTKDTAGKPVYASEVTLNPQGKEVGMGRLISPPELRADELERRIEAIDKRRSQLETDFSRILETPVEELQGRIIGISDEQISTAVDKQIRAGASKNLVGSGVPITLDDNDNIADPLTGEPIDYTGALQEQIEGERQLLEQATVDLSPEYLSNFEPGVSPFSDIIDATGFQSYMLFDEEISKGLAATKTRIPGQREALDPAMKTIRELLEIPEGMSDAEVSKAISLSVLTVAEAAYGKMGGNEIDLDNPVGMEEQAAQLEELGDLDLEVLENGGVQKDSFTNMLKTQMRNRIMTQPIINEEGVRIQKKPFDDDALQQAAEVAISSMLGMDTISEGSVNLVQEKVNGRMRDIQGYNPQVPVYFVNEKAYSVVRAATDFIRATNQTKIAKKSSVIPGGKRAALANQGKVFGAQKGKAAQAYEDVANNVAFFVDNQSLAFASTMLVITQQMTAPHSREQVVEQVEAILPGLAKLSDVVMNTKLFESEANLSTQEFAGLEQARRQEAATSALNVGDATQILVRGMQVFPQHTTDVMNMRLRNTEMDMNPQRSKIHRGVMQPGKPVNVGVTFKNRTVQGNESIIPAPIISQVDQRVRNEDYKPLTAGELEASHLFIIAYNLLEDITGIDPSGLSEAKILSLITPAFLQQAAEVGRIFNEAFPKDIDANTFKDPDLMQSKIIDGLTKLFPEEQVALAKRLPQMAKGDWGYKFKSYVAAADYLDTSGNSITSKVTGEYDYNSAGLSFMQTDAGRKEFIALTGIVSDVQQNMYDDALAYGSPRNLFLDKIIEQLQSSEINTTNSSGNRADSHRIADALSDAKLFANSKKELIKMAKGILLTIGYAKPAMFQHENIRNSLDQIPELAALQRQGVDVVNILNYAVSQSVRNVIDTRYATKSKQAAKVLTMMGIPSFIEMDDGSQVPLFKMKSAPIEGATPIEVVTEEGKTTLVARKEKVPNLREQGKPKSAGDTKIIPSTVASIANRPGAISGQSRETMSLRDSVLFVNTDYGRALDPVFFSTTYDNIAFGAEGAFYFRAAMNGKAAKNALAFNNTEAFLRTAAKQMSRFSEVIPEIVVLNKTTPYGALLEEIQLTKMRYEGNNEVDDIAQQELDNLTRPKVKKFLDYLSNHPNVNVRKLVETDIESDETITLSRKEFSEVMGMFLASLDLNIQSFLIAANKSKKSNAQVQKLFSQTMKFAG